MADFSMFRGDSARLELNISRDGVPVDVTIANIIFTMTAQNPTVTVIKVTGAGITPLDMTIGKVLVTIEPEDTTPLLKETGFTYDAQVTEATGLVTTVVNGNIRVMMDVTPN